MNLKGRRAGKLLAGVAAGCLIALSSSHAKATVIFSDGFTDAAGGSTVNGTDTSSNVTSTSTSYDPASNKNSTATLVGPGDLELAYSSTSGAAEYEALFTQSPVTLSQTGVTSIEADLTFVATSGDVLQGAGGNYTFLGLFNSNGNVSPSTVPYTGLGSSGLGSGTADAANGVQGWVGYNGQIGAATSNGNYIFYRGGQSGSTQAVNQDLVTGGVNSGYSVQTSLGTNSSAGTFAATIGDTYTQDLTITLNPSGSLTIIDSLYQNTGSGSGTAGTLEEQSTSTAAAASNPNLTYDGIGFGLRGPTQRADYSLLTISDVSVPEPACLSLLGLCGCSLLRRRRRVV